MSSARTVMPLLLLSCWLIVTFNVFSTLSVVLGDVLIEIGLPLILRFTSWLEPDFVGVKAVARPLTRAVAVRASAVISPLKRLTAPIFEVASASYALLVFVPNTLSVTAPTCAAGFRFTPAIELVWVSPLVPAAAIVIGAVGSDCTPASEPTWAVTCVPKALAYSKCPDSGTTTGPSAAYVGLSESS